jgi:hypothetical protein
VFEEIVMKVRTWGGPASFWTALNVIVGPQETKVLQTIDRLKIRAEKDWALERNYRAMQLMALPKR